MRESGDLGISEWVEQSWTGVRGQGVGTLKQEWDMVSKEMGEVRNW